MSKLDGKIAIVTGGAKGLGAVYSEALAKEGAKVVIADLADGAELADEIGGTYVRTDVSEENSVKAVVGTTLEKHKRIDILVNNAAVFSALPPTKFTDIDAGLWDKGMAVNVRGPFLMAKHVAPSMIEQASGKIVNISSGSAYKGQPPLMVHYIASKGAVLSLTRALSRELGEHGICVNTLAPGLILSDSILKNEDHVKKAEQGVLASRALKRHGYPDDLVGALLFLASNDSNFVSGQTLAVDGGSINT